MCRPGQDKPKSLLKNHIIGIIISITLIIIIIIIITIICIIIISKSPSDKETSGSVLSMMGNSALHCADESCDLPSWARTLVMGSMIFHFYKPQGALSVSWEEGRAWCNAQSQGKVTPDAAQSLEDKMAKALVKGNDSKMYNMSGSDILAFAREATKRARRTAQGRCSMVWHHMFIKLLQVAHWFCLQRSLPLLSFTTSHFYPLP